MSEGIYRKSGSENSIQRLLQLFRADAFSVQLTRSEYSEHDVANALKRFMRDLPETMLGRHAASFISISSMQSTADKLIPYKELLARLPVIEYQTLRKLIGHLHFIQSQSARNKMHAENLAIVWGPTLLEVSVGCVFVLCLKLNNFFFPTMYTESARDVRDGIFSV